MSARGASSGGRGCAACARRGRGPFCALTPREFARLDSSRRTRPYRRGRTLYEAGDPADALFCVDSGSVKISVRAGGEEHILRLAGPGSLLGLREVLSGRPHERTAVVLEEGVLCRFPAAEAHRLLADATPFALDLIARLAGELDAVERRLVERAQYKGLIRLASLLAATLPAGRGRGGLRLTRRDLAQLLGIAPESVVRLLAQLRRLKLVRPAAGRVEVPDRAKLEEFVRRQASGPRVRPSR